MNKELDDNLIYDDELPVVIYDISLRANNDYESEGTH